MEVVCAFVRRYTLLVAVHVHGWLLLLLLLLVMC
jgi:hypothetical protein